MSAPAARKETGGEEDTGRAMTWLDWAQCARRISLPIALGRAGFGLHPTLIQRSERREGDANRGRALIALHSRGGGRSDLTLDTPLFARRSLERQFFVADNGRVPSRARTVPPAHRLPSTGAHSVGL